MTAASQPPKIVAITIVSGRHDHLAHQLDGVAAATVRPAEHIIVAMDDPAVHDVAAPYPSTQVVDVESVGAHLPLAHARNLGARTAIDAGADLLVFLDVDCVPGPELFRYYAAATERREGERLLFSGPVTYLPPQADLGDLAALTDPHRARPNPDAGVVILDTEMTLFWSLSFALSAANWQMLGGFSTAYEGYGGEDTDFAMSAAAHYFRLAWVGGAHAYHQYHPVSDPPVEHLDDILRNARIFHSRWGWWPMQGWLDAFRDRGLIAFDASTDDWVARRE
ncbi:glycosyltransferase family 2 protein [Williamsia soli]|uniref:glycosyltransferase family 2 protein n=1 Tax=Williamsia soli TaxID=364929 RepID=UPI0027DDECB3|nr:galactosyltransferase-related protein [Williamsia soli]